MYIVHVMLMTAINKTTKINPLPKKKNDNNNNEIK